MAKRPTTRDPRDIRRQHRRVPLLWQGAVKRGLDQFDCAILNLSAGGAKLRMADPERPVGSISLCSPHFGSLAGRVIWQDRDQIGVAFRDPPAEVVGAIGDLLAVAAPA